VKVTTAAGAELEVFKNKDGEIIIKDGNTEHKVVAGDIAAGNGVIHVVDGVFAAGVGPSQDKMAPMNIIEVATANGNFGTLLDLVETNGLTKTLGETHILRLFS
jgi:uncharacterized surface protein with fasciclin (FAS1) repeats